MKIRALIVDDEPQLRQLLIFLLKWSCDQVEWDFRQAADGAEALELLDPRATDLVFVDWNMPRVDGAEFIRRMRERRDTAHIPVVMVTANEPSVGCGADAFIPKPVHMDDLKACLQPAMDRIIARGIESRGVLQTC